MIRNTILGLVLILQLPACKAFADTYYVDAISGNDGNAGTDSLNAWRSLERVNEQVFKPGDVILFRSGRIYEGQLKPRGSGNRENPVRTDRYGSGYKPRLQGNGVMPATVYLYNLQGWTVRNLDISNYGAGRAARRAGVMVQLEDFGTAHAIRLDSLDIHDVNGSLVKKEGGGAGIIFRNGGKIKKSRFDGLLVENCTIKRCERNGLLINGHWSRQEWYPNLHVVIRRNLIEGVPGDGIVPTGCDGALVEWNVMRDCPRLLPDGEAAAGIWPWSCDNTLIQYNEVSDHKAPWDGQGFDSDWNCRNTVIQYNYSHDNEGGFLLICNDGSSEPPHNAGNTGTIIRYNVSVNDGSRTRGKHAGFSPVIHLPGPARNTQIYNNVILVPAHRDTRADSTLIAFDNWHGYPDSTLIANNIFYALSPADYEAGKATRIFYEHNLYYGTHLERPDDPSPVLEDPLFRSLKKAGHPGMESLKAFLLQEGSPALKKGKPLAGGPIQDLFGNKVLPGRAPDIGVHEFNR